MTLHSDQVITDAAVIESLVRRYRQLGEAKAAIEEKQAEIRERFESLVPIGFSTEIDGKPVYRSNPSRSFSLESAIAIASRFDIPVSYVREVDVADLKERLKAAGLIDDAMLPGNGKPRVAL